MPFTSETAKKAGKKSKRGPEASTVKVREAVQKLLDNNSEKIEEMFDKVAKDDPKGALYLFRDLLEFSLPKLSRTEFSGDIKTDTDFDPSKYTDDELKELKELLGKAGG